MPLNIDFVQILLHILNFVILFGALTLLLFNPAKKIIDDREKHFKDLQEENERKAKENDLLKEEYTKKIADAEISIAEMKKDAENTAAISAKAVIDDAKTKAHDIISAAEKDAEAKKENIINSAQKEIGELVVCATQKILSDSVTPEQNKKMYDEFIKLNNSKPQGQ